MYREIVKKIIENIWFSRAITTLILLLAIVLGLETNAEIAKNHAQSLNVFHTVVLSVFTLEIVLKLYVYRYGFFKNPWNIFDFTIVAVSYVPLGANVAAIRLLRVLRLLRLITVIPQMRRVVEALLKTIPGMASIAGLMFLIFYIFAIMANQLYGSSFPEWFGTLGNSFYTLFQIMTLESWSMGIVRPIMEVYPMAWMFFVPFIIMVTFIVINLVIAIIVDAMEEIKKEEMREAKSILHDQERMLLSEIDDFKRKLERLESIIKNAKK